MHNPRRRLYADLRAASSLGGYYFNLSALAPRLDFMEPTVPDEHYTCGADGRPTNPNPAAGADHTPSQMNAQQILQRVASSGF